MQTAAILAGGRARRLGGRDKSRLVIGGRTILERQIDVLRRGGRPHRHRRERRRSGSPTPACRCWPTPSPGAAASGGIYTAVTAARRARAGARVRHAVRHRAVPGPGDRGRAGGRHRDPARARRLPSAVRELRAGVRRPAPGARIEPGALQGDVDLLADVRVRELGPDEIAPFDPDGLLLLNVNTPGRPGPRRTRRAARRAAGPSPIVDAGSKSSQRRPERTNHDSADPGRPSRPRDCRRHPDCTASRRPTCRRCRSPSRRTAASAIWR